MGNQQGQPPQWQPNTQCPSQWQQPRPGYTPPPYQQPYYPPQQQYYQPTPPPMMPPPKKKSRLWLWIVLGIAGVLVCSCIGFGVLAGKNTQPTTITTSSSTSASTTAPSSGSQVAKVGQTITVSDVATMLVSVQLLAADEFTKPKSGNEFIVVHVKLVNNSNAEIDYNPFDFHVRSGSGNITDEEFAVPSTYTANNELNSGKLSPGGTVEGDIIFQMPKGDHKAQLTWQPSFFGNAGDNAWNLGL